MRLYEPNYESEYKTCSDSMRQKSTARHSAVIGYGQLFPTAYMKEVNEVWIRRLEKEGGGGVRRGEKLVIETLLAFNCFRSAVRYFIRRN